MPHISLSALAASIHAPPSTTLNQHATLHVSPIPDPFVPPTLQLVDGELSSEVTFIRSPAAVGKSVTAQYLSGQKNVPLLNLADVPVGTGSLQGLISDYTLDGKDSFHSGNLTVIVDSLDEGRLLSGESSLEAFLFSLIDFMQQDRSITDRPKLIFFGREESADFSKLALQISSEEISVCTLSLEFFDSDSASKLIDLYATKEIDRLLHNNTINKQDYTRRKRLLLSQPMQELKSAFFKAIEQALEIPRDQLWTTQRGRTFAGYAPVLASIGTLLADVDNPVVMTNRLRATATREAWDVIDSVIQEILLREKYKLVDRLQDIQAIPENAYDTHEQLSYLLQLLGGKRRIELTRRIAFRDQRDANVYLEKVSQICMEHPFIRSGKMTNEVLGSVVFAHAICNGMTVEGEGYTTLLRELSEGPFLWRAARREVLSLGEVLVEGGFVGFLLNSYWNDPMEEVSRGQQVIIQQTGSESMKVTIPIRATEELLLGTTMPLTMYGRMRDCEITAFDQTIVVEGATLKRGSTTSLFRFEGTNRVICSELWLEAKATDISGSLWLGAGTVVIGVSDPQIRVKGECEYGWGGAVSKNETLEGIRLTNLGKPIRAIFDFSNVCRL